MADTKTLDATRSADAGSSEAAGAVANTSGRLARLLSLVRAEDILLAAWVGALGPAVFAGSGTAGPFDAGQPVLGALRLVGLVGALACLATRNSDDAGSPSAAFARTAAIGPLTGGLMLVGASGFAGFGFDPAAVFGPILVAVAVFSLLGSHAPALRTSLRRTLVTPFVLAAGGLFWSFVREFIGPGNIAGEIGSSFASDSRGTLAILGFLTVTAAVYYAMLVYAPRQVAEREGGPLEWAARFALFLVGIGLGLAGLAVLGT